MWYEENADRRLPEVSLTVGHHGLRLVPTRSIPFLSSYFRDFAFWAGAQSWQTLVVNAVYSDGSVRDVTAEAKLSAATPGVLKLAGRVVKPSADGEAEVVARYRGLRAAVPVTVKGAHDPSVWSFRNQ